MSAGVAEQRRTKGPAQQVRLQVQQRSDEGLILLRVAPISSLIGFGDVVPTGLAVSGNTIYLAEAGPVPHNPEDGKVVRFTPNAPNAVEVASGAPLLVDVALGRGRTLFALSQGDFPAGGPPGAPAIPDTGSLVRANGDGAFSMVADGLDLPTSLEIIQNSAYIATLSGEVWKIENISCPPYGVSH